MIATISPNPNNVVDKQYPSTSTMNVRTRSITPSSVSSPTSTFSTSTTSTTEADDIDMDEDYDIITPISLTPYQDDQATDYLNTTYTPANKITSSTSALNFHIAHGPYSVYPECPECIRIGPRRQWNKQPDASIAKPAAHPVSHSSTTRVSKKTFGWAAASTVQFSQPSTPTSSPSSVHAPSLPTANPTLAFRPKPSCTCWRCRNACPGDIQPTTLVPSPAPTHFAAITTPMMYEQALEDYDHKNRGGFLLIPKPAGVVSSSTTGTTTAACALSVFEQGQASYVQELLGASARAKSAAKSKAATMSCAPPSSFEEAQDAYVRSLLGTSSTTLSCAPPSSYEEAQEDFHHEASALAPVEPAITPACVPPTSYEEAREDYDNDIVANDAHTAVNEDVDESKPRHTLVYVRNEGCVCWYCGDSNSESAQRTPTSGSKAPCVSPSSYEEVQEDYRHHHHTSSRDDTSASANTAVDEVESTQQQKHTQAEEDGNACWYCGEVPRTDGEAPGEGDEKEPGCVACYKRSAMCFLPTSKPCRGMIC